MVIGDCIRKLALEKEYDAIFNLIKMTESTGTISYKGKDQLLVQVVEQISSSGEVSKNHISRKIYFFLLHIILIEQFIH